MINILNSAMNYGQFQIWLFDCEVNEIKLTINAKIRKFLEETSIEGILNIYDIEYGYDNSFIKKEKHASTINYIAEKYPNFKYSTIQLNTNGTQFVDVVYSKCVINNFSEDVFVENYCLSEEEKNEAKRLRSERKNKQD